MVLRVVHLQGQVPEDEDRHVVSGQVRQPEQDAEHSGLVAPPDAGGEQEEGLQGEAGKDQALQLPFVPQLLCGGHAARTRQESMQKHRALPQLVQRTSYTYYI